MIRVTKPTRHLFTKIAVESVLAGDDETAYWASRECAHIARSKQREKLRERRVQHHDNHIPSSQPSPGRLADEIVPLVRAYFKAKLDDRLQLGLTTEGLTCPFCSGDMFCDVSVGGVACCYRCAIIAGRRMKLAYQAWHTHFIKARRRNPGYLAWRAQVEGRATCQSRGKYRR